MAAALDDFALSGAALAVGLFGSAILALALQRRALTGPEAFALSRLDEAYQEELWGIDEDAAHRTAFDWSGYPILRFEDVPERIDVHIIDRPGQPFLGTGEAGQGPTAAVIGNALADAVGVRLRDLPLSPERVKAAIGV